jgi:hypothetical protein
LADETVDAMGAVEYALMLIATVRENMMSTRNSWESGGVMLAHSPMFHQCEVLLNLAEEQVGKLEKFVDLVDAEETRVVVLAA